MNGHDLFRSANVSRLDVQFVPGVLTTDLFVLRLDSDTHFHVMPKVRFFFLLWSWSDLIKKPRSVFDNLECTKIRHCYKESAAVF